MKFNKLAIVALLSFVSIAAQSFATTKAKSSTQSSKASPSAEQDLDSLADDQALVQRAQAMDPQNHIQIVQKRAVNRNYRLEVGGNYGYLSGGDSYLSSQNIGAYLDFHFTPRWSAGLRYNNFINQLTSEGASVYQQARAQQQAHGSGVQVPGIDSASNTELATIAWYPVYGKMNFFNSWVPHFDLYALAGFGKTQTQTGNNSDTFAGGLGLALWLSQHFSSHLEVRYQSYEDTPYLDVTRRENLVIGQIAFGILL